MLSLRDVSLAYGDFRALDGIDLDVHDGEIVCVLGPSGSGKSSMLRVVAGLEPGADGTVSWDGRDLRSVPPHRRGFGLMFQDHTLFPHRDVVGNVAFGLRMQGLGRTDAETRAANRFRSSASTASAPAASRSCRAVSSSASPLPAPSPRSRVC